MVLCGLMVDASFAPSCRSYYVVNIFWSTFCASGLIWVPAVYFSASYCGACCRADGYPSCSVREGWPQENVTQNGTDLYFSAKFLKLSMIFRVILTSFRQACSPGKGLFQGFRAEKGEC